MAELSLYASAPLPLCTDLAREIEECGGHGARISGAGVAFRGTLEVAYRVCLWSRLASRVLLEIKQFPAPDAGELYACVSRIDWSHHLNVNDTLAVDCTTRNARINHSHFAALRVKDAIVDWFSQREGARPSVDVHAPDLRLHLHLHGGEARLYVDLAGQGLHRRGYRNEAGPAPLRETLAAGMLYMAQWPQLAARGLDLLDPMCGSGTLVIEAAMMAADIAPGMFRQHHGFLGWAAHEPEIWNPLLEEARCRYEAGVAGLGRLMGRDRDPDSVRMAMDNARRAGVAPHVHFEVGDVAEHPQTGDRAGLLVSNPPYGVRLHRDGDDDWRKAIEEGFPGWRVVLILPRDTPVLGGPSRQSVDIRNGALECRIDRVDHDPVAADLDSGAFANRLRKRDTHLKRWARRRGVSCYRIYDADLPDYALAVDRYLGDRSWLHVSEYEAPPCIDPLTARRRLEAAVETLPAVTGVPPQHIVVKRRRRQRGGEQYRRLDDGHSFMQVTEHGARALVNLHDFVDTGLFLDHRPIRLWLQQHASGTRFLNLFAYTAMASVHAALGGASTTLSLDLSRTYCDWARRNLALNGFQPPEHRVCETECMQWLAGAEGHGSYDLIFLDPPTFSNSKKMHADLDIQRDHPQLIRLAMGKLAAGGTLLFSCNRRRFKLDPGIVSELAVTDMTRRSLDEDFARSPPPHRCYSLRTRDA